MFLLSFFDKTMQTSTLHPIQPIINNKQRPQLVDDQNIKHSWRDRKWNWALWMDPNSYILGIGHGDTAFFFMCLFQGKRNILKVFCFPKGIKYPL